MKMKRVKQAAVVFLVAAISISAYSIETRHKTFTKEEIKSMSETMAVINTKFGDITLKFFSETAPNHVDNFIKLANDKFYDGTIFHRIIPDFMIQGGDPNTKSTNRSTHGTGGPGYQVKAEFSNKSHKRGILSMARSNDPNSAGSQFFICVADVPHLNGNYTVFGEVVTGLDVVDKIVAEKKDGRDNPIDRIEMTVSVKAPESPEKK